jgi:hypothetical protein
MTRDACMPRSSVRHGRDRHIMRHVEPETNPNAPTARQGVPRGPAPRHFLARVSRKTPPNTNVNTIIMPWVDVQEDVAAIRAGRAVREGNAFHVHGRTYVLEPGGRLFPRDGDGFHQLDRGAFRALALYNDPVPGVEVEWMLDRESISLAAREVARRLRREGDLE